MDVLSIQFCFLVLYVRYVMKPSPMMNKVGSGPMQLTGPLSNQAPPYVRCYTPPSNSTNNTLGQGIVLQSMILSNYHKICTVIHLKLSDQAPPYVRCYTLSSNNTNTVGQAIASPTDYQIILKFVLLSIKHYPTKCEVLYTTTIK